MVYTSCSRDQKVDGFCNAVKASDWVNITHSVEDKLGRIFLWYSNFYSKWNKKTIEIVIDQYSSHKIVMEEDKAGLKIIFASWPVMLTSQSHFSLVTTCFWMVKILKNLSNVGLIETTNIICLFLSFLDHLKICPIQRKA